MDLLRIIIGLLFVLGKGVQSQGNNLTTSGVQNFDGSLLNGSDINIDDFQNSWWNVTTSEPEVISFNPDMTLEEIDALLGTDRRECITMSRKPNIQKALIGIFGNRTVNYLLCRCYRFGCPGQTEEELEQAIHEVIKDKEVLYDDFTITAITSYGMVILIGVVGNILVMVTIVVVFRPVSVTNMYIFSLAVADFLVCSICIPLRLHSYILNVWLYGDETCKILQYLYFVLFMCSVFTLTAMSLERWFVICFPMKAQYISSVGRTRIFIVVAWILAFILALPVAFHAGKRWGSCLVSPDLPNRWPRSLFLYILITVFLVPCCVIGFAYFHTAKVLWSSLKVSQKLKGTNEDEKNSKGNSSNEIKSRIAVIQLLIAIWVVFVICWGPYLVFNVVIRMIPDYFDPGKYMSAAAHNHTLRAFNLISMANSAVNPILYAFMSKQFRHGFLCVMTCQPLRTRRDVTSTSRVTGVTGVSGMTGVSTVSMSAKV